MTTLLGTRDIPGTAAQQEILRTRIGELARANGEAWIADHREELLHEWACIVCKLLDPDPS